MLKCSFLIVAVFTTLSAFAAAQGESGNASQADAAFKAGVSLYGEGKFDEAANAFRRANAFRFNWKIFYNIGQSESAAKNFGDALSAFEEYLARGGDDIPVIRRDEVVAEIQRLKLLVGYLDVEAPAGSVIYIDDVEKGRAPLAGPVLISAAITHQVRVVLNSDTLLERDIRLSGGQTAALKAESVRLEAAPTKPPATEPEPGGKHQNASLVTQKPKTEAQPKPRKALLVAGWTTAGIGACALIAGGAVGGIALSKGKDLDSSYPGGVPSKKAAEVDTVNRMALSSDILIGVGAAAAAAGIAMLTVHYVKTHERNLGETKKTQFTIQPAWGPNLAGAMMMGEF